LASQILVLMRRHQGKAISDSDVQCWVDSLARAVAFGKARDDNFGIVVVNNIEDDEDDLTNVEEDPDLCVALPPSCIAEQPPSCPSP
jgi:hypothetical protein